MPYLDGHLYWKWNNIDLRIQRNMTQQHNTGKTQQHNIEKDLNWLDKLETRQLKKIQQNWNGSSSRKGVHMDQIS